VDIETHIYDMNSEPNNADELGAATQKMSRALVRQRLKELNNRARRLLETDLEPAPLTETLDDHDTTD